MIIKAKHNLFLDPFFRFYVIWKMKRNFHSVEFSGEFTDQEKPVLLIGNHVSWWDGIWALNFNQHFLHRKFYFMMLEEQLRKNWFFRFTGGFSIRKHSRSALETLNYAAGLLASPAHVVLMFPSGKIQSMHTGHFVFEKGVEKILRLTKNEVHRIFIVNLVDYLSSPRPVLYTFFKEFTGDCSTEELEKEYNRFYLACVETQKQKQ